MSNRFYTTEETLRSAAATALLAPSIFNTQPWSWRVTGGALVLRADRDRRLAVTDPTGRMLAISCGVALHHAVVALTAEGHGLVVDRLPDPDEPDLLARITIVGDAERVDVRLRDAIARRHTDRRPFADTPVADANVDRLRAVAEARGVYVAELSADVLVRFQVTAARAGELDENDPAYRAELAEWTHRPVDEHDGVAPASVVPATPRKIPLRSFFPEGGERLLPGPGQDGGARYLLLWTTGDDLADWLAAGEALSAALLQATADGLAVSPMTDIIEVPFSRTLLHRLLDDLGEAQIALRIGVPAVAGPAPATPRRTASAVIRTDR